MCYSYCDDALIIRLQHPTQDDRKLTYKFGVECPNYTIFYSIYTFFYNLKLSLEYIIQKQLVLKWCKLASFGDVELCMISYGKDSVKKILFLSIVSVDNKDTLIESTKCRLMLGIIFFRKTLGSK